MKICFNPEINFQRRLTPKEEAEYSDVLAQGKQKIGNCGKSVFIIPSASMPQADSNNTGVGSITSQDGIKFLKFVKKYMGINEVQLLPNGQYHCDRGVYPIYSGTSMDFGNHIIDIKSFLPEEEFKKIVRNNSEYSKINYKNIVDLNSVQEQALMTLYENMTGTMQEEFNVFKHRNNDRLDAKGIYRALREMYNTHDYKQWSETDKNLYDDRIVSKPEKEKRISEIYKQKKKTIDFYKFKQFLAEKSFFKAKEELNSERIKINGDMPCGFSYDEVWANPKAFLKDSTIGWGLPALNYNAPEAEELLKQKVKFYAQHYDGIRVDASWLYAVQKIHNTKDGTIIRKDYADKYLQLIDDVFLQVKGYNYDLHNIMHEFTAASEDFNMYSGNRLKPFVEKRNKIITSDHLNPNWGSNQSLLTRGWDKKCFIIGARNHDSKPFSNTSTQRSVLSKLLKIPDEELKNQKIFINAKLAEPFGAYNNMLFFMDAFGIQGEYKANSNKMLDYTAKIPSDYEKSYFRNLELQKGFNPMDALEKIFKAKGLDKTDKKLYKKIVKYKKILEGKEAQTFSPLKTGAVIVCAGLVLYGLYKCYKSHSSSK